MPPPISWPSWINTVDPFNATTAMYITSDNCNAVAFGTYPVLGDQWIGRVLNNTDNSCTGLKWSLSLSQINWSANVNLEKKITMSKKVFDTSNGAVRISDGYMIDSAYDATVEKWNNELWVAFECYGIGQGMWASSSCVGPLLQDNTIDLSRTNVVIFGTHSSASVPKLLVYKGHLYLYWSSIVFDNETSLIMQRIVTRGAELAQESSEGRRLWVTGSMGKAFMADSPSAVEVWGLDPSDPRSNTSADMFQTVTDGTWIYFTGARGGSGCFGPGGTQSGCYRLTIGRTQNPLGYHSFNAELIPDSALPPNPQEYYRFVYRPDTGNTWLVGGNFLNPASLSGVMTGTWAFPWPENILKSQ